MPAYRSIECTNCGESFAAHESAKAAETAYCSPACHSAGAGLA